MDIVSQTRPFVVGVDTHARTHTYAVLTASTGQLIATRQFPTSPPGIRRALGWINGLVKGDLATMWVIECAATFGARLARAVADAGYDVVEAARMDARAHHSIGKSDPLDAHRIGAAVLPLPTDQLRHIRADDGIRAALRVLITAREDMSTQRTASVNALTALLRVFDLGLDARRSLTDRQIALVASWRSRKEDLALGVARHQAVRLAKQIRALDAELTGNHSHIDVLVKQSEASALLDETGIGPVTAAIAYTVWSHPGRVHSDAAFASIAGVSPIPASSGNTTRQRLSRGDDRRLNRALHMATVTRMTYDPETRAYVDKRRAEGRTTKEIRRCLKRYLARRIYRVLEAQHKPQPTT